MAHWIDTETQELFANTLVDSRPRHAEFVKGGTEMWVSSEIGGTITVFDVATQTEKAKIDFEVDGVHPDRVQPVGFEFTNDDTHAFVALGPSNHIAALSMPRPMRLRNTSLSDAASGTWISTVTGHFCSLPTVCRVT